MILTNVCFDSKTFKDWKWRIWTRDDQCSHLCGSFQQHFITHIHVTNHTYTAVSKRVMLKMTVAQVQNNKVFERNMIYDIVLSMDPLRRCFCEAINLQNTFCFFLDDINSSKKSKYSVDPRTETADAWTEAEFPNLVEWINRKMEFVSGPVNYNDYSHVSESTYFVKTNGGCRCNTCDKTHDDERIKVTKEHKRFRMDSVTIKVSGVESFKISENMGHPLFRHVTFDHWVFRNQTHNGQDDRFGWNVQDFIFSKNDQSVDFKQTLVNVIQDESEFLWRHNVFGAYDVGQLMWFIRQCEETARDPVGQC